MKTQYRYLTDFDTNSGVTENSAEFSGVSPGLDVPSGAYIVTDNATFDNFGLTTNVKFSSTTASQFRILLGVTVAGVGRALDFNLTSGSHTVSLVNISSFTGVADSTQISKEFAPRINFETTNWYKVVITIANNVLRVSVGDWWAFESNVFSPTGTLWGFSGMASANTVIASDTYQYTNQVFWGNVNVNGVPNAAGVAVMFKQFDASVVDYQACNADGDYAILVTDDIAALNKYFIIGYVRDLPTVQPRGVCNLTL